MENLQRFLHHGRKESHGGRDGKFVSIWSFIPLNSGSNSANCRVTILVISALLVNHCVYRTGAIKC